MKKLFMFIFLLFCNAYGLFGQSFRVIDTLKTAYVKEKKLDIGNFIFEDDIIKLEEGAKLTLLHQSGKVLNLEKEGTFNHDKLKKILAKQNPISKFGQDFARIFMSDSLETFEIKDETVCRCVKYSYYNTKTHQLNSILWEDKLFFSWRINPHFQEQEPISYNFYISDMGENIKYSKTGLDSNGIYLDLSNYIDILKEDVLIFKVIVCTKGEAKQDYSSEDGVGVILHKSQGKLRKELVENTDNIENEILKSLTRAYFFEKNELYLNALTAYRHLLEITNFHPFYYKRYENYLKRHNFDAYYNKRD